MNKLILNHTQKTPRHFATHIFQKVPLLLLLLLNTLNLIGQSGSPPSTVPNFVGKINGQNINGMVVTTPNPTINFTWNHATDADGIERYQIILQRPGLPWIQAPHVLYPLGNYNMSTSLVDGASYNVHIRAKDNVGNWGSFIGGGSFTVSLSSGPDLTPPSTVPNFLGEINGQNVNGMTVTTPNPTINFNWGHATDASGIEKYQIILQRTGTGWILQPHITYPSNSYIMPTSLVDGASYSIHIRAKDNAGNWGAFVNGGSFSVDLSTGPDLNPPSTVPDFVGRINGQNISGLVVPIDNPTINFTWNHATDASGIERYHLVFQKTSGGGWIHHPQVVYPGNSYTMPTSNLEDGASYSIHIRAKDNAGNWGIFIKGGEFSVDLNGGGGGLEDHWSNPATWPNGVPGINDDVIIPTGKTVILDVDANVRTLTINGELIAKNDEELHLSSHYILVSGNGAKLQWGSSTQPYLEKGVITLKHDPSITVAGMGFKFLGARLGGTVEIHGKPKVSWTKLSGSAAVGATGISLVDPVNTWEVGDEIVIASTDFDPHQAEVRTITSVGSKSVTFNGGLQNMHYGKLQYYDGVNEVLDERAEVGLLTRNIRIEGDMPTGSAGIGGHCMFHGGSTVHFSGVELYLMGQRGSLGRYPFHWHNAGNVNGQYIKNSSIHRSFNRVVTVHNTNYALVEDNVGYDHIGHGYFLEAGTERFNTFRHNLGLLTKTPASGQAVMPHDDVLDVPPVGRNRRMLPATFWITNPDNSFIDNACGGSEGSGFWMVVAPGAEGRRPLRKFDGNSSHSTDFSNFAIDGSINSQDELSYGHYAPQNPIGVQAIPVVKRLTAYKCRERNVWIRANTMHFIDCAMADSPRLTFFAFNQILKSSLLVGKSGNRGKITTSHEQAANRSLPYPNKAPDYEWNIFSGHTIYDGPSGLSDVHFAGFDGNNSSAFNTHAAAQKSPVHWVEGLTFENGIPFENKVWFGKASGQETMYAGGILDLDGSLTGRRGNRLTPQITATVPADGRIREDGFNIEPGAFLIPEWDAYECRNEKFGLLRNFHEWPAMQTRIHYNLRSDGPATYGSLMAGHSMNPVILNKSIEYGTQYERLPNQTRVQLVFADNGDKVVSVFPNMPSSTYVYAANGTTPLPRASSLANLRNSNSQKYYLEDNTLYLKHIAATGTNPWKWQYGSERSSMSPSIKVCQNQNCDQPTGYSDLIPFADFERGIDGRITANGTLGIPTITTDVTNPNISDRDGQDNRISWNITTDGDGIDEYNQVRFSFDRQVWTGFNYLYTSLTGSKFEVWVHDISNGWLLLGNYDPGTQVKIPLNPSINRAKLDEVDGLLIRIKESFLGSTTVPNLTATINLFDISLSRPDLGGKSAKTTQPDDELPIGESISLYPNPTGSTAYLEVSNKLEGAQGSILVFNSQGKVMGSISKKLSVGPWRTAIDKDVWNLTSGVYSIVVRIGELPPMTKRLVIQ